MTASIHSITFDCERPALLARFWAAALGYRFRPYDDAERARLLRMGIDDVENDPEGNEFCVEETATATT